MLKRAVSPRGLEAIDRSKRQLSALMNDLRLLDRDVVATGTAQNGADSLQKALDTTVAQLGSLCCDSRLRARRACWIDCWQPVIPLCAIVATRPQCYWSRAAAAHDPMSVVAAMGARGQAPRLWRFSDPKNTKV